MNYFLERIWEAYGLDRGDPTHKYIRCSDWHFQGEIIATGLEGGSEIVNAMEHNQAD